MTQAVGTIHDVRARDHLFVGGDWVSPASPDLIELVNPTTEEVMSHVPDGSAADVDRAVAAARAAFEGWAATPVDDRAKLVERMHDVLVGRLSEIGLLVAEEIGCPLPFATLVQVGGPLMVMASLAEVARTYPFEEEVGLSLVVREPVGVVAAITPWNYPLLQVVQKVAAALAAGCTVVLKPSELAPLTAYVLADAADEVRLPPGVLNVVTGRGPAGEALVGHPGVDLVSFTGSSAVGGRVAALAAGGLRRVVLELGGKSANLVLDDADLERGGAGGRPAVLHERGPDVRCLEPDGRPPAPARRGLSPGRRRGRVLRPRRPARRCYHDGTGDLRRIEGPGAVRHRGGCE